MGRGIHLILVLILGFGRSALADDRSTIATYVPGVPPVTFVTPFAPHSAYTFIALNMPSPVEPISRLMVKIAWDEVNPFYGTAIHFRSDDDRVYFLTNAHILPSNRNVWPQLHMAGYLTKFYPLPFEVVGLSPGYDLAVLALPRDRVEGGDLLRNWAPDHFASIPDNRNEWKIGILGVPGYNEDPRQFLRNELWSREARHMVQWTPPNQGGLLPISSARLSEDRVRLPRKTLCPPPFVSWCYHAPIRSWGFSGGTLVAADPKQPNQPKIVGIVSHYSPMAEVTYVIPTETALRVGDALIRGATQKGWVQTRSDSGTFRYVNPKRVEITKGPLAGAFVESMSVREKHAGGLQAPGGGESSGGGGESSGGGGESSGGGGELRNPRNDFLFLMDMSGNVSGLLNFHDFSERTLQNPRHWHQSDNPMGRLFAMSPAFRGIETLFNYRPGVMVNGTRTITGVGGKRVVHLQSFLSAYDRDVKAKMRDTFPQEQWPSRLSMPRNDVGLASGLTLQKFKTFSEIQELPERSRRLPESQFSVQELALFLSHLRLQGRVGNARTTDVITARNQPGMTATMTRAHVENDGKRITVVAVQPNAGMVTYRTYGMPVQLGESFFQYKGQIDVEYDSAREVYRQPRAYGILTLQRDLDDEKWELKLAIAYKVTEEWVRGFTEETLPTTVPEDTIFLEAAYLPLAPETRPASSFALDVGDRANMRRVLELERDWNEKRRSERQHPELTADRREAEMKAWNAMVPRVNRFIAAIERRAVPDTYRRQLDNFERSFAESEAKLARLEATLGRVPQPILRRLPEQMSEELRTRSERTLRQFRRLETMPENLTFEERVAQLNREEAQTKAIQAVLNGIVPRLFPRP